MIIRSRAPLRISFGGGGTDVPPCPEIMGGTVINATIDRYAYVSLQPNEEKIVRVRSLDFNLITILRGISEIEYNGKLDLVKATIKHFHEDLNDKGFDVLLYSDSLPGSGLGSSSAIVVALVGAMRDYTQRALTLYEIADAAYHIERIEMKIKGGLQDQYASAFGGFNFIEFGKSSVVVNSLRIKDDVLNELLANLLLLNTRISRFSSGILERQIQAYVRKEEKVLESLKEIKRLAWEMKNALLRGELNNFGELLGVEWEYKKMLDEMISNPYIDKLYEKAREMGALGGKITGAGAGGHLLLYCEFGQKNQIAKELEKMGCEQVKFNFDFDGLRTWRVRKNSVEI